MFWFFLIIIILGIIFINNGEIESSEDTYIKKLDIDAINQRTAQVSLANESTQEILATFTDRIHYITSNCSIQKDGLYMLVDNFTYTVASYCSVTIIDVNYKLISGKLSYKLNYDTLYTLIDKDLLSDDLIQETFRTLNERSDSAYKNAISDLRMVTDADKQRLRISTNVAPKLYKLITEKYPEWII